MCLLGVPDLKIYDFTGQNSQKYCVPVSLLKYWPKYFCYFTAARIPTFPAALRHGIRRPACRAGGILSQGNPRKLPVVKYSEPLSPEKEARFEIAVNSVQKQHYP